MKVRDFVSIIKDDSAVSIVYGGFKITEFKAPFWNTIEADILDLEIRSVAFPGKSVIIETKTGRPTIVSTAQELETALDNSDIKFIKLGADIAGSFYISGSKILDLAGHEIATASSEEGAVNAVCDALLDIFDSESDGLISGSSAVTASDNATVNLHGGDYVSTSDEAITILAHITSKVNIYDGFYSNLAYDGADNVVLFATDDAAITCYGGRYRDEDPSPYVADGYYAAAIPDTDPVVYEVKKIL